MKLLINKLALSMIVLLTFALPVFADSDGKDDDDDGRRGKVVTLIQIGDTHSHEVPRPNERSDGYEMKGGLSRVYTKITDIRSRDPRALLFNAGDTLQGGAVALYTEGQSMVNILDHFGIDFYAAGNWDFVYGLNRFIEFFGSGRWGAIAANLYYDGAVYPDKAGQRVLPPYRVKTVKNIKIGVIGLTSDRAINALGPWRTLGAVYTKDASEVPYFIDVLRNQEKVDAVVLLSEFGLAKNIDIANTYPGIDVLLSADMHEETPKPVISKFGTLVSEVGQDGVALAEIVLTFRGQRLVDKDYIWHSIGNKIKPNAFITGVIAKETKSFVSGPFFTPHVNPINGTILTRPINAVVGYTDIALYRGNFTQEFLPGVLEGTSHDFLADAFRHQAQADIGSIRGFRYGTHIRPGRIQLDDLYHYMPIGAQIAKITITGQQLKNQIETSLWGALAPDVDLWLGGWVNGYSGVKFDVDPYAAQTKRAQNIQVKRAGSDVWEPLDLAANYSYAGYWFAQAPTLVNGFVSATAAPIKGAKGEALDVTEVVTQYLETKKIVYPETPRINLLFPLPPYLYGNPEVQPLQGVAVVH